MVFYRKYRPQQIADLDKEDIRVRLTALFAHKEIPHAFLFAGPRGTGKTSASRIVAKIVNCEKPVVKKGSIEPCNICTSCQAIANGNHMDILEIDAASNRGIDEIRALRERVNLSPAMGKKKVYIIDEVHMLTREAFNALLKTLEEPPSHVLFILATTEIDKLPETVLSRCTTFIFNRATVDELVHSLGRVVSGEKMTVSNSVLKLLAIAGDGSFRDAVKLLEQAKNENLLTESGMVTFLKTERISIKEFIAFLKTGNTKEALMFIQDKIAKGSDLRLFVENLLDDLHSQLLGKFQVSNNKSADETFSLVELKELIELLSKAYLQMKNSYIESLPLEMAVIEWCEK